MAAGLTAGGADLVGHLGDAVLSPARGDNGGAGGGQSEAGGPADAGARAGDDGDSAVEPEIGRLSGHGRTEPMPGGSAIMAERN